MNGQVVGHTTEPESAGIGPEPADKARAGRPADRPEDEPEGPDAGLWTVAEAAAFLQLPIGSIYKMTARRAAIRIPHIRIGALLRFRRADLEAWLEVLTVSNLDTLTRARERARKAAHGTHSQAPPR